MGKELATSEHRDIVNIEDAAMSVDKVVSQINLIQKVMKKAMKEKEHYGIIPGTTKPTLLKPGAEKLCLTFRLDPQYDIINSVRDKDFIAYTVKCTLIHIPSSNEIATGIGSCNSREKKYRYYSKNTGKAVPGDYWESRDCELLGGPQFSPRKVKKQWMIFEQVENDNPWDLDNTLVKMACKRALVAATLNATAASDIFTQDVEELPSELVNGGDGNGQPSSHIKPTDTTGEESQEVPSDKEDLPADEQLPNDFDALVKQIRTYGTQKVITAKEVREITSQAESWKKDLPKAIDYLKTQIFAIREGSQKKKK